MVSADDRGMAFAHLATRGTGALGRIVKTTRILGRYPNAPLPTNKALKPSTVLAFASLPLGNTDRSTDTLGLTAMLTPYLLVIVSTTPVAQTQHKSARPKEVARHSAMSGCLAWFPAVKLKVPDPATGSTVSKVKLVYCWSNVLTVLDVDEVPTDDPDKPPALKFRARSRWTCDEAIVAVQWLSRSVLTVLTITQRLIVLEDKTMRVTDGFDLIHKHIYHADLFSEQLHALVEQLDEEDPSMHGVVADAFYMSVKAYKSRLFLLGFDEISIGTLSNWSDRLHALMDHGDHVAAIQLATSYYTGDSDKLTVGLPEDAALRHSLVKDKVNEIMSTSVGYVFGQYRADPSAVGDQGLRDLTEACFVACQSIDNTDFIFDEMYDWYEDSGVESIFLEALESYILERVIQIVPPAVIKAMVTHYVSQGWQSRLEEMICRMDTMTLDLDQITTLCKQHRLYDALIYVWNQAMGDYITPLIDLLSLLVPLMDDHHTLPNSGDYMNELVYGSNARKIFPYLAYTLTRRVYPTGEPLDEESAIRASAELYWFFFSGNTVTWPREGGKPLLTRPNKHIEPSFPYLRLVLKYDAPSFLSALNEAFEDPFLNDAPEKKENDVGNDLPEEQIFGQTVDRQYIVSILLEIMNPSDFAPEDTIYLDMFIARNLPKFPQYLLFPGSTLTRVLTGLCNHPGMDLAEDAQLSAEYLLSVHQPPDIEALNPLFKKAGFYRILKRIYKGERQYGKLMQAYFEDPDDREQTFDCLADCLRAGSGLTSRQVHQVLDVIRENAVDLVDLNPQRAATTLASQSADFHREILESTKDMPHLQFQYLKALLEPEGTASEALAASDKALIEHYVRLMCAFEEDHVGDYVGLVKNKDLRLDELLPTMEEAGAVEGIVALMTHDGMTEQAMQRLTTHLDDIAVEIEKVAMHQDDGEDPDHAQWAVAGMLKSMQRYVNLGIRLCQGQLHPTHVNGIERRERLNSDHLSSEDELWLSLIEATVRVTRKLSEPVSAMPQSAFDRGLSSSRSSRRGSQSTIGESRDSYILASLLRSLVQLAFTALLTDTAKSATPSTPGRSPTSPASPGINHSFLRILRAFLSRAAKMSPSLADLREVLQSIFSAYAYERSILELTNRLLENSLFTSVQRSVELRQRGWRPRGSTCEACGRRLWGPGVGSRIVDAWEEKKSADEAIREERKRELFGMGNTRGKGKATTPVSEPSRAAADVEGDVEEDAAKRQREAPLDQVVLLACRHIYHRRCLDSLQIEDDGHCITAEGKHREYRCPIDG